MKYRLREFESSDTSILCNSLNLITSLNRNLLPERIPKIKYEQVEKYWQKTYGKNKLKTKRSEDLLKSTDLIANTPIFVGVNQSIDLTKAKSMIQHQDPRIIRLRSKTSGQYRIDTVRAKNKDSLTRTAI